LPESEDIGDPSRKSFLVSDHRNPGEANDNQVEICLLYIALVRFREGLPVSNGDESSKHVSASTDSERAKHHPLFGALKDVTILFPGVDLTEPADPDWANLMERRGRPHSSEG
jgi:hypothetical protein